MKYLSNIIVVIVFVLAIFLMIKKVVIPIIQDLKKYKRLKNRDKEKMKMILMIFYAPVILLFLDYFDIFSKIFPKYFNLSREYDWLSFIGTYSGAIVSAILLIFITEKDRDENTAVLRAAQRPYLDISYMKISNDFFKDTKDKIIVFEHGNFIEKHLKQSEYLTLCIKNTGASVAIIDTNKTKIKLQYKVKGKIEELELTFKFSIDRLSIRSGEEIYIKFTKEELYKKGKLSNDSKILSSSVYYKDLFNKNYYDKCELKDTLIVLHDNEELEEVE